MERMPPSRGRYIAVAVFVLVLTFSPYAHADTSASGINDPITEAVQLWTAMLSSIDSLAHQLASALQLHQTLTATPHAPNNPQQPAALAASAALATQPLPETATTSENGATSDQTTQSPFVKSGISTLGIRPDNTIAICQGCNIRTPREVTGFLPPIVTIITNPRNQLRHARPI
jgi:hypothetical protein